MKWKPTPKEYRITARRLIGETWEDCQLVDLRPGDIFRSVSPFTGEFIHPDTHEPDDACIARVNDLPIRNDNNCNGSLLGAVGYGVPIDLYASMDDLKRKGLS